MDNIKDIVCENLINLRKEKKLTQKDLAAKINYSDKAVSRWENGESMPDYDALQTICNVLEVPVNYLFSVHEKADEPKNQKQVANKIALIFLYVCVLWTIVGIVYVYINAIYKLNFWQIFVWGVPASFLILFLGDLMLIKNNILKTVSCSLLLWSILVSVYIQTISYNIWPLFLIGIPAQVGIILAHFTKKK